MSKENDIWWTDPECHDCKDPDCKHGNWTRNVLPLPKKREGFEECKCLTFEINAPEGCTFRACNLCGSPFVYDGTYDNCILCEMHVEVK